MAECECPEEHSITKLGHCRSCPFYRKLRAGLRYEPEKTAAQVSLFVCGSDKHADGTPHDFDWATYSDETESYGVCRCGYDNYSHAMLTLP